MKVVSVWNPKGGQGKSTVSINLAAAALEIGLKPIIIDRDYQGTAMKFYNEGNLPYEVLTEIPTNAPDADIVILDHMASDYDVPEPRIIVMTFFPIRSQYSAYLDNKALVDENVKEIISVVTNGDSRVAHQRDTMLEVRRNGVYQIKRSGAFGLADSEYRTIFDKKFDKLYRIDRTRNEVSAILTAIIRSN